MMRWYRKLLVRWNRTTGNSIWEGIYLLSVVMMMGWGFFILPMIGFLLHIGKLGRLEDGLFIIYNAWSITQRQGDYYFLITLFSIAWAKFSYLLCILSDNYRRGYVYIRPECGGGPVGHWIKANNR